MYKAVYDVDISTNKDKMAQHDREMVEAADLLMIPGSSGYKFIPFLHWLPSLNTSHLMLRQGLEAMSEVPWNLAMEDMVSSLFSVEFILMTIVYQNRTPILNIHL